MFMNNMQNIFSSAYGQFLGAVSLNLNNGSNSSFVKYIIFSRFPDSRMSKDLKGLLLYTHAYNKSTQEDFAFINVAFPQHNFLMGRSLRIYSLIVHKVSLYIEYNVISIVSLVGIYQST